MSLFVNLLLLFSFISSCMAIIGGTLAPAGAFPYMAAIFRAGRKRLSESHVCAATVIDNHAILTTADCCGASSSSSFFVRAGTQNLTFGGSLYKVSKVVIHPKHVKGSLQYNFCVLRTTPDFSGDGNVVPALLSDFPIESYNNLPVKAIGWGRTNPTDDQSVANGLQEAEMQVVPAPSCADAWRYHAVIDGSTMCTAPAQDVNQAESTCYGDIGGPVVNDDGSTILGIIAYQDESCSASKRPNIQSDVYLVRDWIEASIN